MREQVPAVLPPLEKRKASINSCKREDSREPILHVSRESHKWMAFENKSAENPRVVPVFSKDQKAEKKANTLLSSSLLKTTNLKDEEFSPQETTLAIAAKEEKRENTGEDGDLGAERMIGKASSSREGAVLLQWGQRKRPRCSRVDNHLKHSSLTDESSVLSRKMVRVKAEKVSVAAVITPKGPCKVKNGMAAAGRDRSRLPHPHAEVHAGPEEGRKRQKILRGGPSELGRANRGTPLEGVKGACSQGASHKKNPHVLHHSKARPSPDNNKGSPDRSVVANGGAMEITPAQTEFDWPKILISLSRKEKEDDFLILKGTKLPQRPKRRPKAVEKAIHFCTPGSWLTDLSRGRYDVREKKCVKKKPRGLKAMESMDSDTE